MITTVAIGVLICPEYKKVCVPLLGISATDQLRAVYGQDDEGMGAPATPVRLSSQAIEPRKLPQVSTLRASILAATSTAYATPSRKRQFDRAAHKAVLCNTTATPSRWLRKAR